LFGEPPPAAEEDEEAKLLRMAAEARARKNAAAEAAKKAADEAAAAAKAEAARKLAIVDKSTSPDGPACTHCGARLTNENASRLKDGKTIVHIGCPKAPPAVTPPDAPASKPELASEQPAAPAKGKPGPKPKGAELQPNTVGEVKITLTLDAKSLDALRALLGK
jgi:hypothetical protein